MNDNVLLELRSVGRRFHAPQRGDSLILDGIDLDVHQGEIVALVGRSGCGKSTLLRIVSGLMPPTNGTVRYRGQPVTRPVPGISMVFQSFGLFPWLSVLENVELGLEAQGVAAAERRQRALQAIDMIGLDGFESAYPRELSGGMRQRVGFARALVVNPDVLLMDEPFSALDVPTSETLRNDLLTLWLERQIPTRAILMVSHSLEEVLLMADRVVILDSNPGRIKQELPITLRHPRDEAAPAFRQLLERLYSIMTGVGSSLVAIGLGHPLPKAGATQMTGVLGAIAAGGGERSLADLADDLEMDASDLFPILEALELLDFARLSEGHVQLTPHGRGLLDADIQRRKAIFGEHLLRRVPLARHIRRVLDERPGQQAPRERFLHELEDYMSPAEAERVMTAMINWGRYAEIFEYDAGTGLLLGTDAGTLVG